MEDLRRRCLEGRRADHARQALLDDLMQKLDDMQKTMDRNAFVVVLIDGDCTFFLDDLVKKGIAGGEEAAKLLRRAVFDYLRYDDYFKHDHKIVIRIYANLRGLAHTYLEKGIIPNTAALEHFALGFNKAHPLCDFIDAGNHKEAADSKIKENLNLYVYNVHCKQIIFGASADNGYASFLGSFLVDTEIQSRIKLLKGLPFAMEFGNIKTKLHTTEFNNIFRSKPLAAGPMSQYNGRQGPPLDQTQEHEPKLGTVDSAALPWRSKLAGGIGTLGHAVNEGGSANDSENFSYRRRDHYVHTSDEQDALTGPLLSTSLNSTLRPTMSGSPSTKEVAAALVDSTNDLLRKSPRALDFGEVKREVEQKLGLTSDFWGRSEHDEWFQKSKTIIKKAVEDWMERTGNPPPKNATWLRQYFGRPRSESPSVSVPEASLPRSKQESLPGPIADILDEMDIRQILTHIFRNAQGQRVDYAGNGVVHPASVNAIRDRFPRLCNTHHLLNSCPKDRCEYDHDSELTDDELWTLLFLSRSQACPQGPYCNSVSCIKGHTCPNGRHCKHGNSCRFAHLHRLDTIIVEMD